MRKSRRGHRTLSLLLWEMSVIDRKRGEFRSMKTSLSFMYGRRPRFLTRARKLKKVKGRAMHKRETGLCKEHWLQGGGKGCLGENRSWSALRRFEELREAIRGESDETTRKWSDAPSSRTAAFWLYIHSCFGARRRKLYKKNG